MTAISASGEKVAVLTEKRYRVYNTNPVSISCTGDFTSKPIFRYSVKEGILKEQSPYEKCDVSEFSCIALSDKYLAIGAGGRLLVFIVVGECAGRWVCDDSSHADASFEGLKFSDNGEDLLALLRVESANDDYMYEYSALIYSTAGFPGDNLERQSPVHPKHYRQERLWPWEYKPTDFAFSPKGTRIAICTTYSGQNAKIGLLRKIGSTWKLWDLKEVQVFEKTQTSWHGKGLTGISLYCHQKFSTNLVSKTRTV